MAKPDTPLSQVNPTAPGGLGPPVADPVDHRRLPREEVREPIALPMTSRRSRTTTHWRSVGTPPKGAHRCTFTPVRLILILYRRFLSRPAAQGGQASCGLIDGLARPCQLTAEPTLAHGAIDGWSRDECSR